MSHGASPAGALTAMVGPTLRSVQGGLVVITVVLVGCSNDQLAKVPETITVAQGEPTVGQNGGQVEQLGPVNPGSYTQTNPFQVDRFAQKAVAKTDILWMIDNSGSMAPKQAKLQGDFTGFMQELTPDGGTGLSIDYHIGVVTTDTYNPAQSGRLQNPAGLSSPWISNTDTPGGPAATCPPGSCDPVAQFKLMSNVGTDGSGDEKGMLAAAMALTSPLTDPGGPNAGFLRSDASLTVILVSDEEDGSCAPLAADQEGCNTSPTPSQSCSADPSSPYCTQCTDLTKSWCDADLPWGNVEYWSRQFQGIKGVGNENLVNLSVFVGATEDQMTPTGVGIQPLEGCLVQGADPTDPFSYAIYSPRYMTVATNVSGSAAVHSICSEDFSAAEQQVAIRAALENTFYLSREPLGWQGCTANPTGDCKIQVLIVPPSGGSGTSESSGPGTWTYQQSENAIVFAGMVPVAGSTIVISYPVNA